MDDDLQILTLPYNNDLYTIYNKTNNVKVFVLLLFHIAIIIVNWILSFVFPIKQNSFSLRQSDKPSLLSSYNLTVYCHLVVWLITLAIRCYFKDVYYKRLRILGYNNHHDRIKKFVLFPSFVLHHANAFLLLATVLLNGLNISDLHVKSFHIRPIHCAELIISIAYFLVLINNVIHFYHELKFRRFRNPPDVFCVDDPSGRLTSDGLNQVAIRSSSFLEDLLENQADLIYNLKLQNAHLRELLFKASQSNINQANMQPVN
ncbi:hypothetical protein TYRP_007630 [Tyrophagus putrescentiae]|nr:hypothetical protein TYRP_007630 [Tyrophagus putrescentiae]